MALVSMNIRQPPIVSSLGDIVQAEVRKCLVFPPVPLPTTAFAEERPAPISRHSIFSCATYVMDAAVPENQTEPYIPVYSERQWQGRPVSCSCGIPGLTFRTSHSSRDTSRRVLSFFDYHHLVGEIQRAIEETVPKRASREGSLSRPPRFRQSSLTPSTSEKHPY